MAAAGRHVGADPPAPRGALEPAGLRPRCRRDARAARGAARGGPLGATWGDRQPVRFVVGFRGDDTFDALAATLKRGNAYARAAGALILVCADEGPDERTALYSAVDAGAAIANATVEAVSRAWSHIRWRGSTPTRRARRSASRPTSDRWRSSRSARSATTRRQPPELVERDSRPRTRLAARRDRVRGPLGPPHAALTSRRRTWTADRSAASNWS